MKKNNLLNSFVPIIIILIAIVVLIVIPKFLSRDDSAKYKRDYIIAKTKYSTNEYIPILVSDEQMTKKYILDYLNATHLDIRDSYYLLDKEYRNNIFGNIDKYVKYVNIHNFTYEIEKFSVYERGKYKYYDVYDINGNHFIFKTNGVMQYSVMFDDEIDMGE